MIRCIVPLTYGLTDLPLVQTGVLLGGGWQRSWVALPGWPPSTHSFYLTAPSTGPIASLSRRSRYFLTTFYLFFGSEQEKTYLKSEYMALLIFPGGASGKKPACQCRRCKRHGFGPWVRKMPWRRKWWTTPVFLSRESHGSRSLEGCGP